MHRPRLLGRWIGLLLGLRLLLRIRLLLGITLLLVGLLLRVGLLGLQVWPATLPSVRRSVRG